MSFGKGHGPSRHFAATQQLSRFRSEADISETKLAELDLRYAPQ